MPLSTALAAHPEIFLTADPGRLAAPRLLPDPERSAIRSIAADHYAQTMGYFCKKEWKFELATGIPLRIRLGSLEQCNHLEGKD